MICILFRKIGERFLVSTTCSSLSPFHSSWTRCSSILALLSGLSLSTSMRIVLLLWTISSGQRADFLMLELAIEISLRLYLIWALCILRVLKIIYTRSFWRDEDSSWYSERHVKRIIFQLKRSTPLFGCFSTLELPMTKVSLQQRNCKKV